MSIIESLKAQLKTLEAQRREHEKAANAIRRNEVKIRKALSSVASLSHSRDPLSVRTQPLGACAIDQAPFLFGVIRRSDARVILTMRS